METLVKNIDTDKNEDHVGEETVETQRELENSGIDPEIIKAIDESIKSGFEGREIFKLITKIHETIGDDDSEYQEKIITHIKDVVAEKGLELNIDSAIQAIHDCDSKISFLETEKEADENEKILERVRIAFASISAKNYYEIEELNAVFNQIEFRKTENPESKYIAKIEGNVLVVFDSIIREKDKKYLFDDETVEFFILHEIGHIIDESGVLNRESFELEDFEDELADLIAEVPLELQDNYSKNFKNPEAARKEIKAHLLAIWAKNRGNFQNFFFERLMRTNPEGQKIIFGDNLDKAYLAGKAGKSTEEISSYAVDQERFKLLQENSKRVFDFLENVWPTAKNEMGDEFYQALGNIGEFEFDEFDQYFDDDFDQMPQSQFSEASAGSSGDIQKSDNTKIGSSQVGNKGTEKKGTVGEVFKGSLDLLNAFSELSPFG